MQVLRDIAMILQNMVLNALLTTLRRFILEVSLPRKPNKEIRKSILIEKLHLTPTLDSLPVKEIAHNPYCEALTHLHGKIKSRSKIIEEIGEAQEGEGITKPWQARQQGGSKAPQGVQC